MSRKYSIWFVIIFAVLLGGCGDIRLTHPPQPALESEPPPPKQEVKSQCPKSPESISCDSSAAGAGGDLNGNGFIDADSVLEIGEIDGSGSFKCRPGLHPWTHDYLNPRRPPYFTKSCRPGYVCVQSSCLSEGRYALRATDCCSGVVDCETGRCLPPKGRFE